ncbi:MAG: hypothetical protein OQJ96_05840 [Flavobacteriales bacterium]|nr:hypothetical protein [Flavobacteriales bacterium]MCW8911944.1 hypothetical protein [Flavobacteriales bacterium]MCW8937598.1 hypothetical protein [Flavobacteriales bacterium]MCW8941104.1 hypothetical protein [Flavobacteriales bacterium]MCW8968062.1 hypothetical protein [Flavobacteriales bacterium]
MTPEQRKRASLDLTLTYFRSYFKEWRLAKVLTIEKLIKDRYDFYGSLLPEIKKWGEHDGTETIAQEIHNGLYHDAISQCIQYIEDLFALMEATKKKDYFIRNIVTYKAGKITEKIKSYKANNTTVSKDFYIPDVKFPDSKDQQEITDGVDRLIELVDDQVKFYTKYWFFYNQYKHGLAVPMRPFGNTYNEDQVKKDMNGEMPPYVVAYDNLNIKAATSKGRFGFKMGLMMPGFTDNVRPFIGDLEKENNFLRFVFPPDTPNFDIDLLVDQAYKTRACINILVGNYTNEIAPEDELRKFQLPIDYKKNTALNCSYKVEND